MNRSFLLLLAAAGLAIAPLAQASTIVPVNLKVNTAGQVAAEKTFKKLIDEWTNPGLDITFQARPDTSLDYPGWVRVYLEGIKATPNPGWYQRFRTFHDDLVKQPYASEVFRHASIYCRNGSVFMQAACLNAGGKVVYQGNVHNFLSMSRAQDTQLFFFTHHTRDKLPAKPPSLLYLSHGSVGDPIYVDLPSAVVKSVNRIHLVDRPAINWPGALGPGVPPAPMRYEP
jgi:hypothetical protein